MEKQLEGREKEERVSVQKGQERRRERRGSPDRVLITGRARGIWGFEESKERKDARDAKGGGLCIEADGRKEGGEQKQDTERTRDRPGGSFSCGNGKEMSRSQRRFNRSEDRRADGKETYIQVLASAEKSRCPRSTNGTAMSAAKKAITSAYSRL